MRANNRRPEKTEHALLKAVDGGSAGFPACGFTVLYSTVFRNVLGSGKSPEPADKNVCATGERQPEAVFSLRIRNRSRRKRLLGGTAGILVFSAATFGCGPWFPNTLLDHGDRAVLQTPRASFDKEIERMKLVAPSHQAKPTTNPPLQSLEADLTDLRAALEQAKIPLEPRDGIIEGIINYHREQRHKIDLAPDESLRPTNTARISDPLPRVAPGLPGEFADYFRGAIAWHQDKITEARSTWSTLLERPAAERHFKSTWAAFMLGRSWEEENRRRAISYFQEVRALAKAGFADSLGLASSSLGYEARLHLGEKRLSQAIDLYLDQAAGGDPSAMISLRLAVEEALEQGMSALRPLAAHPRAQRVVTAYVIARGWMFSPIDIDGFVKESTLHLMEKVSAKVSFLPAPKPGWHHSARPVVVWLEAVEAAGVKDVEAAEQLALAAYQAGEMVTAQRWLSRARFTPVAQWLQAKLLLRDGKVDAAAALLAELSRLFPVESAATNHLGNASLADSLYLDDGDFSTIPIVHQMRGEMGVFHLARRQYTEALQALLESGYWMDAAFVAERVLTLDELKTFVDQRWPATSREIEKAPGNSTEGEQMWEVGYGRSRGQDSSKRIRYLLARRLTRTNHWREARPYYPLEWLPLFDKLSAALNDTESRDLGAEDRARAYFEAAKMTRKSGLELLGTEVEPDWRIHAGDFEEGVTVAERANLRSTNVLAASAEEIERGTRHAADPELRWHYRYTAGALAAKGARLLCDAEMPALSKEERTRALFEAAKMIQPLDYYAMQTKLEPNKKDPTLLDPYPSAILAWKAAQLMPNNSDDTARVLCIGGSWIKAWDPKAADLFYKSLVRRCRKTAIGAKADRLRWFPKLEANGNLKTNAAPTSAPPP